MFDTYFKILKRALFKILVNLILKSPFYSGVYGKHEKETEESNKYVKKKAS